MKDPRTHSLRRVARCNLLGLMALALLVGAGCGKNKRATVSGKVTFNKQPVPLGVVSFVDANNRTGTANIGPDGSYTVTDAPVGEVTIVVSVPKPQTLPGGMNTVKPPKEGGMMKPPPGMEPTGSAPAKVDPRKIPPIPERYQTAKTSPLKFTVVSGTQEHDVNITP